MAEEYCLSPSILAADFTRLGEQLVSLEDAGADWVHVDVMDGVFVPNISMGPFIVAACRRVTELPLDVHLMISTPDRYLDAFASAGAAWLTVHVEACPHIYHTLSTIRSLGCSPGVALNPGTPPEVLSSVLHLVDLVLVLGTNPGFSGQAFIPQMTSKISKIREMLDDANPSALIQVDGGMNQETLPIAYQAGARAFVAGNAVFNHPLGIKNGMNELRVAIEKQMTTSWMRAIGT